MGIRYLLGLKIFEAVIFLIKSIFVLAIFLGSYRMSYEDIKNIVLEVNEEMLSEALIQVTCIFSF